MPATLPDTRVDDAWSVDLQNHHIDGLALYCTHSKKDALEAIFRERGVEYKMQRVQVEDGDIETTFMFIIPDNELTRGIATECLQSGLITCISPSLVDNNSPLHLWPRGDVRVTFKSVPLPPELQAFAELHGLTNPRPYGDETSFKFRVQEGKSGYETVKLAIRLNRHDAVALAIPYYYDQISIR